MKHLDEIKAYLRDINLEILTNHPNVKIDISRRFVNKIRLFYPSRKLIKYVTGIGGVLTGSRAIRCYLVDGKPLLERGCKDWDFVVTLDMAFKICDKMKISEIPKVGEVISIRNQRMWRHPDYSDSYRVGPVDVQLIVVDELPDYIENGGVRISNFGYTVYQKVKLTNDLYNNLNVGKETSKEYSKHIDDLKEIIIKFNSIKVK